MIEDSGIKIKMHNYYGWKNYHAGMDLSIIKGNKKIKVKTSGHGTVKDIVRKVCEVIKWQS